MSTTDSLIASKMGMCPYCVSRRRCFICVKKPAQKSSVLMSTETQQDLAGAVKTQEKQLSDAVVSPPKLSQGSALPPNSAFTPDESYPEGKGQHIKESLTHSGSQLVPASPSKSGIESIDYQAGKAGPSRLYPRQLIIRGEMKRIMDEPLAVQRKKTRHGALPLQRSSIASSSDTEVKSGNTNETFEAVRDTPSTQDTETKSNTIEPTEQTVYDLIDLTSDDTTNDVDHIKPERNNSHRSLKDKIGFLDLSTEEATKVESEAKLPSYRSKTSSVTESTTDQNSYAQRQYIENGIEDESVCSRFSKSDDDGSCVYDDVDMDTKPNAINEDNISNYELMRLERIKRNNEKLESLGFSIKPNSHEVKRKSQAKPKKSVHKMISTRSSERSTRPNGARSIQPKRKAGLSHFKGTHDDFCYICDDGGDELVCCDYCCKVFHCNCHIPPLPIIPDGDWMCCECKATQMTRASKCGACYACIRDNCGTCKFCLDKPRFGGSNILKQVCIQKRCPNKRYAPPAKVTEEERERTLSLGVDIDIFEGRQGNGGVSDERPFGWAR